MSRERRAIGNVATPIEHPDGGVFHLLPVSGQDLKKLARTIVRFEYLQDKAGKTIFNPKGQPVPKFDQDDEAVVNAAVKICRKITDIKLPVYRANVPNKETLTQEQLQEIVEPVLDDDGNQVMELFVADDRTEAVRIGDLDFIPAKVKREILSELYEFEAEEEQPAPAAAAEGESDEAPAPAPKAKKKREQLVAEWVIEEGTKLGRSKREAEEKN